RSSPPSSSAPCASSPPKPSWTRNSRSDSSSLLSAPPSTPPPPPTPPHALSPFPANAVIAQKLKIEDFLATLGALFAAAASLKPLTGLANDIQTSAAAAARLREMMEAAPEPGHDNKRPRPP